MNVTRGNRFGKKSTRFGLSIVEVMICLAITASMLTATAMAYRATVQAAHANDEFFRATQAARMAINHIVTDVRRSTSGTVASNTITLNQVNGQNRTYAYDADARKLTMTVNSPGTPSTRTLASNVTSASFHSDGKTISATVVVAFGAHTITLSGSGMPRRTMVFN